MDIDSVSTFLIGHVLSCFENVGIEQAVHSDVTYALHVGGVANLSRESGVRMEDRLRHRCGFVVEVVVVGLVCVEVLQVRHDWTGWLALRPEFVQ